MIYTDKTTSFWAAPLVNKDYKDKFILSITNSDLLSYIEKRTLKKNVALGKCSKVYSIGNKRQAI